MALPIIQNNSKEIVDVLQTSMDINLDIFSFLEKYAEKQVQLLQEILTVTKKQYEFNVDWRRDEEYQREEVNREKQKPNPPSIDTPAPSAGDNADGSGGSGGSGGFGGKLLGGIGLAMKGLAFGLAAFANPKVAAGGGVVLAFLAGLAGISWLAGKGAQEIGKGFKEISSGIDALDETGKKVEMDNLVAAGKGLGAFLENVGSLKGSFGAVITFLTGDLVNIANGMNKLNTMNVDK